MTRRNDADEIFLAVADAVFRGRGYVANQAVREEGERYLGDYDAEVSRAAYRREGVRIEFTIFLEDRYDLRAPSGPFCTCPIHGPAIPAAPAPPAPAPSRQQQAVEAYRQFAAPSPAAAPPPPPAPPPEPPAQEAKDDTATRFSLLELD